MESKNWVDFKAVKHAVSLQMVLERYQIKGLKKVGAELRGRCPIHKGEGEDAFHVSIEKNCFRCFSCKARGNVLDFVAAMEQCGVRDAALKLQEWFPIGDNGAGERVSTTSAKPDTSAESRGVVPAENPPLTFTLKGIDSAHPYFTERGIDQATAEHFGAGFYAGRGSMSGRIVFPIHNSRGELVAYAGRAIDGSEPRYKLPPGFHKSGELFNLHRALEYQKQTHTEEVIVIEGFFACMRLWQFGFENVVALMGCELSDVQQKLLLANFSRIILMLDGDAAGTAGTGRALFDLVVSAFVRVVDVGKDRSVDELTQEEVNDSLLGDSHPERMRGWAHPVVEYPSI